MRLIFNILIMFTSFSLFAGLKQDKVVEALIKAQFEQVKDRFFYSLCSDPFFLKKTNEINQTALQKIYGPYQLILKGIQPGTRFGLYQFNLLSIENPLFVYSGYIDQNGEAWIKEKECEMQLSNLLQTIGEMLPGEPIYSMVVLADKKTYIAACLVPNPLEAHGKNGRHVTMQLFTHRKACYMACGEHFEPREEITLSIHSKNGIVSNKIKAAPDGTFIAMVEGNKSHGQLSNESMHISSSEQLDPMIISYDWQFLEASKGKKKCYKRIRISSQEKK